MRVNKLRKQNIRNQRGSLALEQVLFIGAVVMISAGIYAFYGQINDYFNSIPIQNLSAGTPIGNPGGTGGTGGQ